MAGSENSSSPPPSSPAAEDDEEADYYYKENMKEAEMLTIERAQVFAARALQDHQIKVSGTTEIVTDNEAVFVSGTAVRWAVAFWSLGPGPRGALARGCLAAHGSIGVFLRGDGRSHERGTR